MVLSNAQKQAAWRARNYELAAIGRAQLNGRPRDLFIRAPVRQTASPGLLASATSRPQLL
jgi:hypothetical protein